MTGAGELTAEMRFWWRAGAPAAVSDWFAAIGPIGEESRTDIYCRTGSPSLGLKRRGGEGASGGLELKGLLAEIDAELPAPVQLWLKCTAPQVELPADGLVAVEKTRRLRRFQVASGKVSELSRDHPAGDCTVELGSARQEGGPRWASLCLEARADLGEELRNLLAVWRWLEPPPCLAEARIASYPAWICGLD